VLHEFDVQDVALKWPNDVLWRHQKLGGILTEIEGDVSGPSAAVIGIGLNLQLEAKIKDRIDQAVSDLGATGVAIGRNALLGRLLARLAEVLDAFDVHGFHAVRDEWERAHALKNRTVAVSGAGQPDEIGVVVGVADDGALLLKSGGGVRRLYSGEISVRPGQALRRA
jgi:BirA family biotin operon repressor/biotin-[acetyl-CoA-carboxylase] ligase